jgi:hypothetical protein
MKGDSEFHAIFTTVEPRLSILSGADGASAEAGMTDRAVAVLLRCKVSNDRVLSLFLHQDAQNN